MLGPQLFGGSADGVQRREVELLHRDAGAGRGVCDARGGVIALVGVADGEDDVCALHGERLGRLVAEPGVGAGD